MPSYERCLKEAFLKKEDNTIHIHPNVELKKVVLERFTVREPLCTASSRDNGQKAQIGEDDESGLEFFAPRSAMQSDLICQVPLIIDAHVVFRALTPRGS